MSVSVYQQHQPVQGAIYAKNTVPDLVLEADEGVQIKVYFKVPLDEEWEPDNILFDGAYTMDFDGRVTVNFEELYDSFLQTQFPPSSGNSLFQSRYWCEFNIVWIGIDSSTSSGVVFRVANAVINSTLDFQSWAQANFLTNQPIEKTTTKDAPEWLTWYDGTYGDLKLKVRFYPKAGNHEDITIFTESSALFDDTGGALCYTVEVSYSRIIKMSDHLPNQLLGYYDLLLIDGKGNILATQRYIYEERTGKEKYFLFINGLGGIDTLICHGENVLKPELTLNIGRFGKKYVPVDDSDNPRKWQQQTGHMPFRWRDWLYELMSIRQEAWKYDGMSYVPIVLENADIDMSDNGQLDTASFDYRYQTVSRAISDTERAKDRTLHASAADQSEPLDDLTTQAVLEFSPAQGVGYATEAIAIPANHIYVTLEGTSTVYVEVNGTLAEEIDPASRMPVVIRIEPGDEVAFNSQDDIETITVNYYPDEEYLASQTATANQQTEL